MSFGAFQKPDVGFGPGVKPSQTIGSVSHPSGLHPSIESGYGMNPILATGDDVFYPIYESTGGNLPFNAGTQMTPGGPKILSPNIESLAEKTDVLSDKDLAELENNYKILEQQRQDKMNKMMELATMGDDRQATAPRPQMVGTNPAARNINPLGHGPLDFGDDALKRQYFEGLYT